MNSTNIISEFIVWLKKQVGCIYVWGGQGETNITEAWIRSMEDTRENAERAIAFWKKRVQEGRADLAAFDCSGLITEFLLNKDIIQSDMTSRGLYAICEGISRSDLTAGDLVFRHNGESIYHVGVYIGGNRVIHARGRDYGVVEETLDNNGVEYWNRFGRLKSLFNAQNPGGTAASEYPKAVEYTGATYVNLRSTPDSSKNDNVIGRVSSGDAALQLGKASGDWCEVIVRTGSGFLRGYCVGSWFKDTGAERF